MPLFEPVLHALSSGGVRFIVVGGVATVLHGHPRLTADLDLVVDLAEDQIGPAIDILLGLGLRPRLPVDARAFADPTVRAAWVEERALTVFSMHDPANPFLEVDVFADPPLPFEALWEHAVEMPVGGVRVRVAAIDDLIAMKRLAGRPQDLADIVALEELRGDEQP